MRRLVWKKRVKTWVGNKGQQRKSRYNTKHAYVDTKMKNSMKTLVIIECIHIIYAIFLDIFTHFWQLSRSCTCRRTWKQQSDIFKTWLLHWFASFVGIACIRFLASFNWLLKAAQRLRTGWQASTCSTRLIPCCYWQEHKQVTCRHITSNSRVEHQPEMRKILKKNHSALIFTVIRISCISNSIKAHHTAHLQYNQLPAH